MWSDQETEQDFLNFSGVAETVAEIIVQAKGRPISIGVAGAWGVGKSSMIKLIQAALRKRKKEEVGEFIFVPFNAWLYQGYDDARAALLQVIGDTLLREAQTQKKGMDKVKELLGRVDWLRAAKFVANIALAGALGGATGFFKTEAKKKGGTSAPPHEIDAIRKNFEDALAELNVKLVVLIDDLDRCLPETTISTLEAIRLFLFLNSTAFVIAADDTMIKHAVKRHFEGVPDDAIVTNYFDKLIQVPIRVPPLGTQEVRAYLMLLFVENSGLAADKQEAIRTKAGEQLAKTWKGARVDRAFMENTFPGLPPALLSRFETSDRLAPLMTSASQIAGNPRLIKRFLNALSIRLTIAKAHNVDVDEAVLAKMLLFERCAQASAYAFLVKEVNGDDEGKPRFLADWEEQALSGQEVGLEAPWKDEFIREWLTVPPRLADVDLRGVLYVSREHAPLVSAQDRLSPEGTELLTALVQHPDMADALQERLVTLPRRETTIIMDRLLERARQEKEWGTPPLLDACLTVSAADPAQGPRLATFLRDRPRNQLKPSIVPKIKDQEWAPKLFADWQKTDAPVTVKTAIGQALRKHGDV